MSTSRASSARTRGLTRSSKCSSSSRLIGARIRYLIDWLIGIFGQAAADQGRPALANPSLPPVGHSGAILARRDRLVVANCGLRFLVRP